MLAGELADQGKTDEAFTMAKELLTNTPEDRMVWIASAQMNVRLRRLKEAEEALDKAETAEHQKRRQALFALSARRVGRAPKAL